MLQINWDKTRLIPSLLSHIRKGISIMTDKIMIDITNLEVALPETQIIIDRSEYESLKSKSMQGSYMTLADVLSMLSVSRPWLLENVLYKPAIRKEIDITQNDDGFVKYPENQGGRYFFLASKTREYFEKHFKDILS